MADTRYYRISPKLWRHAMIHRWAPETTTVAVYLLTCSHRNLAGLYLLPIPYVVADLRISEDVVQAAFATLEAEDVIRYDAEHCVLLLVNALQYDAPENGNQRKGALKYLAEVPDSPLWQDLLEQAQQYAPQLAEDILTQFPKRFNKPLPKPFTEPMAQQNANSVALSLTVTEETATTPRAQSADNPWPTLEAGWFKYIHGSLSATAREELPDYLDALPPDVVVCAFQEADRNNARNWGYVRSILDAFRTEGIRTTADADARAERFAAQKKQRAVALPASRASPPGPKPLSFAEALRKGELS